MVVGPDLDKLREYEKKKKEYEEKKKKYESMRQPVERTETSKIVEDRPKEIIQDELGRIRDEKGNIINLKHSNTSSLKVNQNIAKEERVKDLLKFQKTSHSGSRNSSLFDPSLAKTKVL